MSDKDILDDYLAGESDLSDLYGHSKNGEEGSSAAVDSAILAAAKRELDTGPGGESKRTGNWFKSWGLPLTTAAVVVISSTLYVIQEPVIQQSTFDDAGSPPLLKKSTSPSSEAVEATPPRAPAPAMTEEARVERSFRAAPQARDQMKSGAAAEFAAPLTAPAFESDRSDRSEPETESLEMLAPSRHRPDRDSAIDADAWLKRIAALHDAGKIEETKRQLLLFAQTYPNEPLPGWAEELQPER